MLLWTIRGTKEGCLAALKKEPNPYWQDRGYNPTKLYVSTKKQPEEKEDETSK